MEGYLTRMRAFAIAITIGLSVSPSNAALIPQPVVRPPCYPVPIPIPPASPLPFEKVPLMGTEYAISGFNSWLPGPESPTTVRFDGVPEAVGSYLVNESIREVVNSEGRSEMWIDFEFTRRPDTVVSRGSSPIAADMQERWRVNLADLQLPDGADASEFYMYFTERGTPAPFGQRRRRSPEFSIGEHPVLDNVSVWRGATTPITDEDLPPGASSALITNFEHYFTSVHDVERGLGVPQSVDGFHIGYRVNVPEPAACLIALMGAVGGPWLLRYRKPCGSELKSTS